MFHFTRLDAPRHGTHRDDRLVPALIAGFLTLAFSTGCTSALTTTYLKGLPWDAGEHAAEIHDETAATDANDGTGAGPDEPDAASATAATAVADSDEAAASARTAAVEEAMGRLATLGTLDAATQATLVATLQRTNQEDWPAVVDEFAAVLATAAPRIAAKPEVTPPAAPAPAAPEPDSLPETAPLPSPVTISVPAAEPAVAADEVAPAEPAIPAEPSEPSEPAGNAGTADFAVRNACFASRVQAWGILDRFATARFRPGQEVIVYFELEHLSASESAAGHTTCIDTALSLMTTDGRRLHAWHFEPIAETCPSRRRDYFARYVLRFPDDAPPGDCRVEVAVTDTLAGTTATTSLPLSIAAE